MWRNFTPPDETFSPPMWRNFTPPDETFSPHTGTYVTKFYTTWRNISPYSGSFLTKFYNTGWKHFIYTYRYWYLMQDYCLFFLIFLCLYLPVCKGYRYRYNSVRNLPDVAQEDDVEEGIEVGLVHPAALCCSISSSHRPPQTPGLIEGPCWGLEDHVGIKHLPRCAAREHDREGHFWRIHWLLIVFAAAPEKGLFSTWN